MTYDQDQFVLSQGRETTNLTAFSTSTWCGGII